jgi:hypothetical protein
VTASDEVWREMLRANPGMREKLLKDHTADDSGRCPQCPAGGAGSGRKKAPCNVYLAVVNAGRGKLKP